MEKALAIMLVGFTTLCSLSTYSIIAKVNTPPSVTPKKPEMPKKGTKYPELPKETIYGVVTQDRSQVYVKGNIWTAEGFWHKYKTPDGISYKLVLFWKSSQSGDDTAPSLYEYIPSIDKWVGFWGWEYRDVEIVTDDKDGISITGQTFRDTLTEKEQP